MKSPTFLFCVPVLGFCLLAGPAPAQTLLFSQNFESFSDGDVPPDSVPTSPTGARFVQVVSGAANEAGGGTGKGAQLYDNDGVAMSYAHTFVADNSSNLAAAHVSFNIAMGALPKDVTENEDLVFGIGQFSANLGANAGRLVSLSFRDTMQVRINGNTTGTFTSYTDGVLVNLYINDYDAATLAYTDPAGGAQTLAPNSAVFYLGTTQVATMSLLASLSGGENGIGKFSYNSTSMNDNINFTIDNLVIETMPVPEPAVMGALLGAAAVFAVRRRGGRTSR